MGIPRLAGMYEAGSINKEIDHVASCVISNWKVVMNADRV